MPRIMEHQKDERKPPTRGNVAHTSMGQKLRFFAITAGFSILAGACSKPEHLFESTCQLVRRDDVEVNEKGDTEVVDIELEWDSCPGDQFQVVRGGRDFATCMQRYEAGKLLPVLVKHWWDNRGYYVWDVYQVGECKRQIEPDSEGSYEKSQECSDVEAYGHSIGFSCSRRPFKDLVNTCPWMARQ